MTEHDESRWIGAEEEPEARLLRADKIEVEVGQWLPDGTFVGELVRFSGEEVGSYTDFSEARSGDDRGTTYTLYRRGPVEGDQARYRVHVERWTRWQGEESEAFLRPVEPVESESVIRGPITYGVYTEEQAREAWGRLFAALGMPNVRDID